MRPYGYDVDKRTIREPEAKVLRCAAERLLEGESLRSLVTELNAKGHRTSAGNPWKPVVLRRILLSDRIVGQLEDGTQAPWEPILDDTTWERLRELLTNPARLTSTGPPANRVYLLTGGAVSCGLCGTDLVARPDNNGRRGYVCPSTAGFDGCGKIRVNAELIETDLAERVLGRLLRPDARERVERAVAAAIAKADQADRRLRTLELRLQELGENYAAGHIESNVLRGGTRKIKAEMAAVRKQQRIGDALRDLHFDAENLAGWWEGATLTQQRSLIDAMLDRVQVFPAVVRGSKRYDPGRVKVTWRREPAGVRAAAV